MTTAFEQDFDGLLVEILTDYRNQSPALDLSQGSLLFIKSACLASALWGAYQHQAYIARQIHPDTADSDGLQHHAWDLSLIRKIGETDAALLERVLTRKRRPPAGGNRLDYETWALECAYVADAWCVPNGQGAGTVDVLILADKALTGNEIPSSYAPRTGTVTALASGKLIDAAAAFGDVRIGDQVSNPASNQVATVTAIDSATQLSLSADIFTTAGQGYALTALCQQVKAHIDVNRPVGCKILRVMPPSVSAQIVTMQAPGCANKAALCAEITAYLTGFIPGQQLTTMTLTAMAAAAGAADCVISAPAGNVTPTAYQMIRPGVINVA